MSTASANTASLLRCASYHADPHAPIGGSGSAEDSQQNDTPRAHSAQIKIGGYVS